MFPRILGGVECAPFAAFNEQAPYEAMDETPTLEGARVRLRAATPADLDTVFAIASEPSVSEWWGPPMRAELADELAGGAADAVSMVVETEGAVAGLIQYHEEATPEFRHAGIDIFLGSAWQGRGLGGEAIELLVRYLFDELGHHRITIDPAAENVRAVASYARAGFEPVGVLRQYQHLRGEWRDGLLMERLRDPSDPRSPLVRAASPSSPA
jgi:aminoglycoside 6'-N-acetyltransferase